NRTTSIWRRATSHYPCCAPVLQGRLDKAAAQRPRGSVPGCSRSLCRRPLGRSTIQRGLRDRTGFGSRDSDGSEMRASPDCARGCTNSVPPRDFGDGTTKRQVVGVAHLLPDGSDDALGAAGGSRLCLGERSPRPRGLAVLALFRAGSLAVLTLRE